MKHIGFKLNATLMDPPHLNFTSEGDIVSISRQPDFRRAERLFLSTIQYVANCPLRFSSCQPTSDVEVWWYEYTYSYISPKELKEIISSLTTWFEDIPYIAEITLRETA